MAGPEETFLRGPQTFSWDPSEEKFFRIFMFKIVHSDVLYKFLADDGAPKRRGARGR